MKSVTYTCIIAIFALSVFIPVAVSAQPDAEESKSIQYVELLQYQDLRINHSRNDTSRSQFKDYQSFQSVPVSFGLFVCSIHNPVRGVHIAGLGSFNGASVQGVQLAGLLSSTQQDLTGTQFAGLVNSSGQSLRGLQLAGLINRSRGSLSGAQIAGLVNLSQGSMSGVQLGLLNLANRADGVQVGLVNLSHQNHGVPVGLVSYVKEVGLYMDVWADETGMVSTVFRTGSKGFANYLGFSSRPDDVSRSPALVLGLGGEFDISPRLMATVDGFYYGMDWNDENEHLVKMRFLLGYRVSPILSLFVGPTLNLSLAENESIRVAIPWSHSEGQWGSTYYTFWSGFAVGLRVKAL